MSADKITSTDEIRMLCVAAIVWNKDKTTALLVEAVRALCDGLDALEGHRHAGHSDNRTGPAILETP